MKKFLVSEKSSLKRFTDNVCAQASFCFRRLLKAREIKVNGAKVGENVVLFPGDEVCYYMTPAEESRTGFVTAYEDENLVVVDKESGVNSEAVFSAFGGSAYPVHRLDRNTEGLLMLAKNKSAEEELLAAFRERRVEKIYYALVFGKMEKERSVEEACLVKDERAAAVRIFPKEGAQKEGRNGVLIVTEYEVAETRGECSLLKITLHTGKTHQIRAHLAYLGHPVVGDEKYGDPARNKRAHAARQKLLCKRLTLHTEGVLKYLDGKTFTSPKNL